MDKKTAQPDTLALWKAVEETDPRYTKLVTLGGRRFTDIDAYWQLRRATELWGPYGSTWGLDDVTLTFTHDGTAVLLRAAFRYPGGSFGIHNSARVISVKGSFDEEWAKKIETNTLSKALSRLGFSADVYMGRFDDSRYVAEVGARFQADDNAEAIAAIQKALDEAVAAGGLAAAKVAWEGLSEADRAIYGETRKAAFIQAAKAAQAAKAKEAA